MFDIENLSPIIAFLTSSFTLSISVLVASDNLSFLEVGQGGLLDILYHNKAAQVKNDEAVANGDSPSEVIIKPIVGCEFYVCEDHLDKTRKDNGYQIVFLAKNKNGYQNLTKLTSIANTDGFYYVPRIDRNLDKSYTQASLGISSGISAIAISVFSGVIVLRTLPGFI